DTTPPVLSNVPSDFVAEATSLAGAIVTYASPTAIDAVDPSPLVVCAPAAGSQFPFGSTTTICTATDASGNASHASFTVTVRDTIPPVVACPANITVHATSVAGAIVNYPSAIATDTVATALFLSQLPPSGSQFPIGLTTVRVEAADEQGNVSRCSFDITVANALPAANPDSVLVDEDSSGNVLNVLANDSDADGDTLTITAVDTPLHGTAAFTASSVVYTPAPD